MTVRSGYNSQKITTLVRIVISMVQPRPTSLKFTITQFKHWRGYQPPPTAFSQHGLYIKPAQESYYAKVSVYPWHVATHGHFLNFIFTSFDWSHIPSPTCIFVTEQTHTQFRGQTGYIGGQREVNTPFPAALYAQQVLSPVGLVTNATSRCLLCAIVSTLVK